MSNSTEFFVPENKSLAVAACKLMVTVEGCLFPNISVMKIERQQWGKFDQAILLYNDNTLDVFDLVGKTITIQKVYRNNSTNQNENIAVFVGEIEKIKTTLDDTTEKIEIIAKDFSYIMNKITIRGQWRGLKNGNVIFAENAETIFNEDGQPNALPYQIDHNYSKLTVFTYKTFDNKYWLLAEVIDYLITTNTVAGTIQKPDLQQLKAITQNQIARDLDLTGLSLLEALQLCCDIAGLRFRFEPYFTDNATKQAIVFYKPGFGKKFQLRCQEKLESINISRANIASFSQIRKAKPTTKNFICQGDYKIYEATFELKKGWDGSLETANAEEFCLSESANLNLYKNVFRKWVLNETGCYTNAPYNAGEAFDFSYVFENASYIQKARRFWPTISCDKDGNSIGYYLEMSYDDGENWQIYDCEFKNLLDECGIWLAPDRLDPDYWVAAKKKTLKCRLTASVISDSKLVGQYCDGPTKGLCHVTNFITYYPNQFNFRKVNQNSILFNSNDPGIGKPNEIDESDLLNKLAIEQALAYTPKMVTTSVSTLLLDTEYNVGDLVCMTNSRNITQLNYKYNMIAEVQIDGTKQVTNLKIESWQ